MLTRLTRITTEIRSTNPYWEYHFDRYRMPAGKEGEYHYVHSTGSTVVVPRLPDGTFILVRQFRYLLQRESLEFPCGGIKHGLGAEENARQELLEETGYKADTMRLVGTFAPCNGITDELCSVYYTDTLTLEKSAPDDSEEFEILYVTKHQINHYIQQGELWDGMTLAAWTLYLSNDIS
ncbi:MAG: NUDIX hydrolase [Candidatus Kapaibacterium sp.]